MTINTKGDEMIDAFTKPTITEIDMGLWKPKRYRYWCPFPVWYQGSKGIHTSKRLYKTPEEALKALRIYLQKG